MLDVNLNIDIKPHIPSDKKADDSTRAALVKPDIIMTALGVDFSKFKVYGGKNVSIKKKTKLKSEQIQKIQETASSLTFQNINNEIYLLINLCHQSTSPDDIILALNVLEIELKNKGKRVIEIEIQKVFSMIYSNAFMGATLNAKTDIYEDTDAKFTIKVAYACPHNEASSLNLYSIADMATEIATIIGANKKYLNLLDSSNQDKAKKVLMFTETAYLFRLMDSEYNPHYCTIYMKRHGDSLLIKPIINGISSTSEYSKLENSIEGKLNNHATLKHKKNIENIIRTKLTPGIADELVGDTVDEILKEIVGNISISVNDVRPQ